MYLWQDVRLCIFGEVSGGKKYRGKTPVVRVPVARCHAVRCPAFVSNIQNGPKIKLHGGLKRPALFPCYCIYDALCEDIDTAVIEQC